MSLGANFATVNHMLINALVLEAFQEIIPGTRGSLVYFISHNIAERLERLNRERQRVEEEILRAIVAQLERRADLREQYTLVLAGEGWHRGVIGIVAQRVAERYHRPALVIGIEDGVGVGSGRSIKRFHLLDALTSVGDLFQRFGGHAQAAGFALEAERIPELTRRFESTRATS